MQWNLPFRGIYFFLLSLFLSDNCVFTCDGTRCLENKSLICDQVYHCKDKTDENNCPQSSVGTASSKYIKEGHVTHLDLGSHELYLSILKAIWAVFLPNFVAKTSYYDNPTCMINMIKIKNVIYQKKDNIKEYIANQLLFRPSIM